MSTTEESTGFPPEGFRAVTARYRSGSFEKWACLKCGWTVTAGSVVAEHHATTENTTAFLFELVAQLDEMGPLNSVAIHRWAEAAGVSRSNLSKHRRLMAERGELVHDSYAELAEANGIPTTVAHFWRTPGTDRLNDDQAWAAMREILDGPS